MPLNEELKVVGRLTRNTRLIFTAEGFIEDKAGNVLATAKATYVKMSAARIAGKPMGPDEWFLVPDDEAEVEVVNFDYFSREDAAKRLSATSFAGLRSAERRRFLNLQDVDLRGVSADNGIGALFEEPE